MQIITAITVDTSKRGVPPRIFAKQGDQKTRILHITVTDGDALYRPEPGITAVLRCLRPDGYRLESACTILDDGRFQAILPPQALEAAGALQADLALSNDQGQLLSTVVFCVLVEPSPIEGQSVPTEQSPAQPSVQPATTRSAGQAIPPTISFVDDDCGKEIFTVLYPWMQQNSVPYNFAVPCGLVGSSSKFASWEQLQQMAQNELVSYSCHCMGDDVMTEIDMPQMEQILGNWFSQMEAHNILDNRSHARAYMYCHGSYEEATVRALVSRYFRAGFTVNKGINTTPFDSFHMKRVGLFPTDGSFTLANAKEYVDQVCQNGGWLIFFTHCYFDAFDLAGLTELVQYIRAKGVEIAPLHQVLTQYGNLLDSGSFNKSKPNAPYLVTDYLGNTYCSTGLLQYDFSGTPTPVPGSGVPIEPPTPSEQWVSMTTEPRFGYQLATATAASPGDCVSSSSENACVTAPVNVLGLTRIRVVGNAVMGHGKYTFLGANGIVHSEWIASDAAGANGNFDEVVMVPEGARTVIVAGSSLRQLPQVYHLENETPGETPANPQEPLWVTANLVNVNRKLIAKSTSGTPGLAINAGSSSADTQHVSDPYPVKEGGYVRIIGHAVSGYGKYSFLSSSGSLVSCSWSDFSAAGTAGNFDELVTVPLGAASIIIAGTAVEGRNLPELHILQEEIHLG